MTFECAVIVRELIDDSLNQAILSFQRTVNEKNELRKHYWIVRIVHLMTEMNWIDKTIVELKADSLEVGPPTI